MELRVFETLCSIDVNDKVEKKSGFAYLTWSYAWQEFVKVCPNARYEVKFFDNKPYIYDEPVKHIRIETSEANNENYLLVYNIKEIDDEKLTEDFSKEEFDKLSKIYSYMTGYIKLAEQEDKIEVNDDIAVSNYEQPVSFASLSVSPIAYTTQETQKNVKIMILTDTSLYNTVGWKNGEFLVKLPEDLIDIKVNSIKSNISKIKISGYEVDKENNFIKIYTNNEDADTYMLTIDVDITVDPRISTQDDKIELYAYNPNCNNYYNLLQSKDIYDVNSNNNTQL